MPEEVIDGGLYDAVMNNEEQYSIWPSDKPLPPGWRKAGKTGSKNEVLVFIEQAWTDMRPQSVRRQTEGGW